MKKMLLIIIAILSISCSVEQRIKNHSYTDEWYYIDTMRFQVYKTKSGNKYIIVLNEKQTRFKRQYIKTSKNGK
jgi:hypothetical protein